MVTMKLLGCFQNKQFVGFFNHLRKTGTRVEGASAPTTEQCWKTLCFWETGSWLQLTPWQLVLHTLMGRGKTFSSTHPQQSKGG